MNINIITSKLFNNDKRSYMSVNIRQSEALLTQI